MADNGIGKPETELYEINKRATAALLHLIIQHHGHGEIQEIDDCQVQLLEAQIIPVDADHEESEPLEVCVLPIPSPKITVDYIKRVVCRHYGISHADIISERRDQKMVKPRHVAMYLAKTQTSMSLPRIGEKFGDRDHSSILFAVRKIASLIKCDSGLAKEVHEIEESMGGAVA